MHASPSQFHSAGNVRIWIFVHLTRFVCGAEKGVQSYAKKKGFQLSNFEGVVRGGGEATPEAFGAVIKHANCIRANWQVTEVFATCTQSKLRGRENQSNALNANGELCLSEINFGITPLSSFPFPHQHLKVSTEKVYK